MMLTIRLRLITPCQPDKVVDGGLLGDPAPRHVADGDLDDRQHTGTTTVGVDEHDGRFRAETGLDRWTSATGHDDIAVTPIS
jgi:hypothetical protein